jgi:acetoin utilization protein AcuB
LTALISKALVQKNIPTLRLQQTCAEVSDVFNIYHLPVLPVISKNELLGMISSTIISGFSPDTPLQELNSMLLRGHGYEDEHIFDIMGKMSQFQLPVIPVLDSGQHYTGCITAEKLIYFMAESYSLQENGHIIMIEAGSKDFTMSEICRIFESEGVQVIGSFISQNINTSGVTITIKTNTMETLRVRNTLERYGYRLIVTYQEDLYQNTLKERYNSLMHYLNV